MKNLLCLLIMSLVTLGAFAQQKTFEGTNGEIQVNPADETDDTGIELISKNLSHIDFTSNFEKYPDYQSRIFGNLQGDMHFKNVIPGGDFIMENQESHAHLALRASEKHRSSIFFETGLGDKKRTFEFSNRGVEYTTPGQEGKFRLNHHNGEKWLNVFSINPYKEGENDYFQMTLQNNVSLNVSYLEPRFKSEQFGYDFIRLGTPQEFFGGLMHNRTNQDFGDGDDFTIFTYADKDIVLWTSTKAKTVIPNGAVGIGTKTIPTGYKMAVDGKVICEELKVQLSQNWADYVFDNDYDLLSLEEVQETIEEKGHLHNTPSAATLQAEGGIELSKMTINQQEKIEEIFLHLIELNKTVKELKAENAALKAMK